MQIGPVDAKTAAARETQPPVHRHVYPTSRPPVAAASTEPEPTAAPSPTAGRGTAQDPPPFSHRLEEALPPGVTLRYVGRTWRASPSEGYPTAHLREQDRIARAALS